MICCNFNLVTVSTTTDPLRFSKLYAVESRFLKPLNSGKFEESKVKIIIQTEEGKLLLVLDFEKSGFRSITVKIVSVCRLVFQNGFD